MNSKIKTVHPHTNNSAWNSLEVPVAADTMATDGDDATQSAVLALEDAASGYANARHVLNAVILQKTAQNECCETERLAHNHLISQELSADTKMMELIMLMHRRTRKETKYQTTA